MFALVAALIITSTIWLPCAFGSYSPPIVSPKKGITIGSVTAEDWTRTGATWGYNWSTHFIMPGIETFAMIEKEADAYELPNIDSLWVMGFNEPELVGQANLTPERAAQLWKRIENKYHDRKLVSPATVHDGSWLDRFRESYYSQFSAYPRMDAVAVHCYFQTAVACVEWVSGFIEKARAWGVTQVWVTEFSFYNVEELGPFVAWMESETMISKYAYYTNREYQLDWPMTLFDRDGNITEFGIAYSKGSPQ